MPHLAVPRQQLVLCRTFAISSPCWTGQDRPATPHTRVLSSRSQVYCAVLQGALYASDSRFMLHSSFAIGTCTSLGLKARWGTPWHGALHKNCSATQPHQPGHLPRCPPNASTFIATTKRGSRAATTQSEEPVAVTTDSWPQCCTLVANAAPSVAQALRGPCPQYTNIYTQPGASNARASGYSCDTPTWYPAFVLTTQARQPACTSVARRHPPWARRPLRAFSTNHQSDATVWWRKLPSLASVLRVTTTHSQPHIMLNASHASKPLVHSYIVTGRQRTGTAS